MRRHSFAPYAAVLACAMTIAGVQSIPPAGAVTSDNFLVRSTSDYVALCETGQRDANYVAAIHFCQGFANGAWQYYLAVARNDPSSRFVCVSDPAPSRDQVIAAYLTWVRANPAQMSEPAVESIFRYLGTTYPCSAAQRSEAPR